VDQVEGRLPEFLPRPEYYSHVRRGYDLISTSYDAVEAQNVVGQRLRNRMQQALFQSFGPGDRVLELGCGTGIEALALASRGVRVMATDISPKMVEWVEKKAEEAGLKDLEARCLAAHEIDSLVAEFGENGFDGAYSHGGVLNMDPDLGSVAGGLATLLRPRARFLCTVVNQASLFEILFYPMVLRPRKAFRRLGKDVPIPITRLPEFRNFVVPTRFYSPARFLLSFTPLFRLRRLLGLQILLPPWNLAGYLERVGPITRFVEALEDRIADKPPFREWGSVFLMELEREPA